MENNTAPQTTGDLLDLIRKFSFETSNTLVRGESVPDANLKIQLKKLNESIKSYILLMDNGLFVDATLIAGHIIEISAIISYIKDPIKQEENTRKYVAKSSLKSLCNLLEFDITNLQNESIKMAFTDGINYLKDVGRLAIKANRDKTEQNNLAFLQYLETESISNKDRVRFIHDVYDLPIAADYIKSFLIKLEKQIGEEKRLQNPDIARHLTLFYTEYCKLKHSNALIYSGTEIVGGFLLDDSRYRTLSALPVILCLDAIKGVLGK